MKNRLALCPSVSSTGRFSAAQAEQLAVYSRFNFTIQSKRTENEDALKTKTSVTTRVNNVTLYNNAAKR